MASEKWGKSCTRTPAHAKNIWGLWVPPFLSFQSLFWKFVFLPFLGWKHGSLCFSCDGCPHTHLVMELRWVVSWALVLLTRGRAVTDVGFKHQGPNDIRISHHNRYAPSHNPDSSHPISSHQSIPRAFPTARLVDLHRWTDWKLATAKLTPSRSGWPNLEKTESSHT